MFEMQGQIIIGFSGELSHRSDQRINEVGSIQNTYLYQNYSVQVGLAAEKSSFHTRTTVPTYKLASVSWEK